MIQTLMNNWHLKLMSLMFAIVLWLFIVGEQKLERGFSVPLELKNVPEGMMVTSEVPSHIDVRIIGPRTLLVNQDPEQLSIRIDLKGLPEGVTTFRRLEDRISLPGGMRVSRLTPSFIDIRLEAVIVRSLKPRVVFEGEPASGFELGRIQLDPPEVSIEGARMEVSAIKEVATEPIAVAERSEPFSVSVPLVYTGKFSRIVSGPLNVSVDILPKPAKRRSGK